MKFFLMLLVVILALLLILTLLSNLRFRIEANSQKDKSIIVIDIYLLFGLIHIKRKLPSPPTEQKKENVNNSDGSTNSAGTNLLKNKNLIFEEMGSLLHIIIQLLRHVKVMQLSWRTRIGTGDAAETGVLTGIAWSIKSTLVGYVTSYVRLQTVPELDIRPAFHEMTVSSEFVLDAKLRVWRGAIAALKMIGVAWKNRKLIGHMLQQQSQSA